MTAELKCLAPRPMARLRLVALPFAGAGANLFRPWANEMPAGVELFALQLPGRENLIGEPPLKDWPTLVEAAATAIDRLAPSSLALYGHSLGAVLGLDLARRIEDKGRHRLVRLVAAARPWPGAMNRTSSSDLAVLDLSDDELIERMRGAYGETPVSMRDEDVRSVVMPALRADLTALLDYRGAPSRPISAPITVIAGDVDPATRNADLSAWRAATSGAFATRIVAGGHYFAALTSTLSTVLEELRSTTSS